MVSLDGGEIQRIEISQCAQDRMLLRRGDEERQLAIWFFLQFFEHLFGPFDGFWGETGEFCDVDSVALIGAAADDFAQKNDTRGDLLHGCLEVSGVRIFIFQSGEFPIVGCKEGFGLFSMGREEIFGDSPGNGDSVVGAGSSADFVQQDERAVGGVI